MGQVTVTVNGRSYAVGCGDGEEDHVRYLADFIDNRVQELAASLGQVGESRLLLMAALMVADDLSTAIDEAEQLREELAALRTAAAGNGGESLEALAQRLEDIAAKLESP